MSLRAKRGNLGQYSGSLRVAHDDKLGESRGQKTENRELYFPVSWRAERGHPEKEMRQDLRCLRCEVVRCAHFEVIKMLERGQRTEDRKKTEDVRQKMETNDQ